MRVCCVELRLEVLNMVCAWVCVWKGGGGVMQLHALMKGWLCGFGGVWMSCWLCGCGGVWMS